MFSACAGEVAAGVGVEEREEAEEKNDDDADDEDEEAEEDEEEAAAEDVENDSSEEAGPAVAVVAVAGGSMRFASSMDRSTTIPPSPPEERVVTDDRGMPAAEGVPRDPPFAGDEPLPPAAAPVAAAAGAPKKLAMVRCFLRVDGELLPLLGAIPLVPIDPPPLLPGWGESEPHIAHVDVSWSLRNVQAGQAHCSRPLALAMHKRCGIGNPP